MTPMNLRFRLDGKVFRPVIQRPEPRQPEVLYTLFRKVEGKWKRDRTIAYPEKIAIRVFGTQAICNPHSYSIRPVRIQSLKAEGISHFGRQIYNEFRDSPLRERETR